MASPFDSNVFDTITAAVSFAAQLPARKVAYLTGYGPLPLQYEHEQGDKHGWLALNGIAYAKLYKNPLVLLRMEDAAKEAFTGPVTKVTVFHRWLSA